MLIPADAESGHCERENPIERRKAEFAVWRVSIPLPLAPRDTLDAFRGCGRTSSKLKSAFFWAVPRRRIPPRCSE